MLVSCALSLVLAIGAASASLTTVQALRLGNFYAGGVANVATLSLFVLAAATVLARARLVGTPARWSASVLLPAGRILSMVWTVIAGVALTRRRRPGQARLNGV